jgi:hypothetical protein
MQLVQRVGGSTIWCLGNDGHVRLLFDQPSIALADDGVIVD